MNDIIAVSNMFIVPLTLQITIQVETSGLYIIRRNLSGMQPINCEAGDSRTLLFGSNFAAADFIWGHIASISCFLRVLQVR